MSVNNNNLLNFDTSNITNSITNAVDNKLQETKSEMGKAIEQIKTKALDKVENIKTKFQPLAEKAGNLKSAFENNLSQIPTLIKNVGSTIGVAGLIAFIPAVILTGGLATIIPLIVASCLFAISTTLNIYDCVTNHKGAGEFFKTMFANTLKGVMLGIRYKDAGPEQQEKLLKEIGDIFIGETKSAAIDFAKQLQETLPEMYKQLFPDNNNNSKDPKDLGLSDIMNALKGLKGFELSKFQQNLQTITKDITNFQNEINDFQAHESLQNTLIGFFNGIKNSGNNLNTEDINAKFEQCITKNLCESIKTKLTDQISTFFQKNTKVDNNNLERIKAQITKFFRGSSTINTFERLQTLIENPKNLFENCINFGGFNENEKQKLSKEVTTFVQGLNLPNFNDIQDKFNEFTEKFSDPAKASIDAIKDFITDNCDALMLHKGSLEEKIQTIFKDKDLMSNEINKLTQMISNEESFKNEDLKNLMNIADKTLGKTEVTNNSSVQKLRQKLSNLENPIKENNIETFAKQQWEVNNPINNNNLLDLDFLDTDVANNQLKTNTSNTNGNMQVKDNNNTDFFTIFDKTGNNLINTNSGNANNNVQLNPDVNINNNISNLLIDFNFIENVMQNASNQDLNNSINAQRKNNDNDAISFLHSQEAIDIFKYKL